MNNFSSILLSFFCEKGGSKRRGFLHKKNEIFQLWSELNIFLQIFRLLCCILLLSDDVYGLSCHISRDISIVTSAFLQKSITTTTITKYVLDNKIILRWLPHPPIYRIFSTFYLHKSAAIVSKSRYMCNFFCTSTLIGICSSSHGSCTLQKFCTLKKFQQNLTYKRFVRSFHQAYSSYFWRVWVL